MPTEKIQNVFSRQQRAPENAWAGQLSESFCALNQLASEPCVGDEVETGGHS